MRFKDPHTMVTLPKDGSLKLLKEGNKTLALEKFTFHLRFESKLLLNLNLKIQQVKQCNMLNLNRKESLKDRII